MPQFVYITATPHRNIGLFAHQAFVLFPYACNIHPHRVGMTNVSSIKWLESSAGGQHAQSVLLRQPGCASP